MKSSSLNMDSEKWILKTFKELTSLELYSILRLRSSIFVVDQNCVFEEIDGQDFNNCYHLFYTHNKQVIAYTRIFEPNIIYKEASISRVCTSLDYRGQGVGKELLKKAIETTSRMFPQQSIRIGAQLYLKKFYESFGFDVVGGMYLEDGIRHVEMLIK